MYLNGGNLTDIWFNEFADIDWSKSMKCLESKKKEFETDSVFNG